MRHLHRSLAFLLLFGTLCADAAELRIVGSLGNSDDLGPDPLRFVGKVAPGMGPVIDAGGALWERAGSKQLCRYALDGRKLGSWEIAESEEKSDQLSLAGETLLLKLKRAVYALPLKAAPGTAPVRLPGEVDLMSPGVHQGRVLVLSNHELLWLDADGTRTPLRTLDFKPGAVEVDEAGTLFAFGQGQVFAWSGDEALPGYPKPFQGERPQKIGAFWFSHAWHGTINRFNEAFEPSPGVVLGGASGSFIGYLPMSSDLVNGRGMALVREGLYAVSGLGGVIQLLQWSGVEERFEVVRRLGALQGINALALDASGNLWTPRGAWRWNAESLTPHALGDKEPDVVAQPVMLDGKQLVMLKRHYNYSQLARGPVLDADGLSHFETPGIKGFEIDAGITGAAVVPEDKGRRLVAVERTGRAFEIALTDSGQQAGEPEPASLPGLKDCTSLAWFGDRLVAADGGELVLFERKGKNSWRVASRRPVGSGSVYVHSDGTRLAVADTETGSVSVHASLDFQEKPLASFTGLDRPAHVAVSGSRLALVETGAQRLLRLELVEGPSPAPRPANTLTDVVTTPVRHTDADFEEVGRPGGIPLSLALGAGPEGLVVSVRSEKRAIIRIGAANANEAFTRSQETSTGEATFVFPAGDWSQLSLAASVALTQQSERFGFTDGRAVHAPFNEDAGSWTSFDLGAYRERVAERREEIRFTFEQPEPGEASLVIEDAEGRRVRNLVSGRAFSAGRHAVVWDGLDENGTLVPPGAYRWRGITHAGIKPHYRMHFANGGEAGVESWGPNHSTFHHAAANGEFVFFAAPVTEGGWALVALDTEGRFVQGYEHQQGLGILHDAIAVDDTHVYVAQDGFGWGGTRDINETDPKWTAEWKLTLVKFEIASGKLVEWPDKQRFLVVDTMRVGPGSGHPDLRSFNLGGLAVLDGRVYVGSRDKGRVFVLDAASGKPVAKSEIKIAGVRHLAANPATREILAATDHGVVGLEDGRTLVRSPDALKDITGLAVAPDGGLWLSSAETHQIHHFDAAGRAIGTLGTPGGPYRGPYDPQRMVRPAGLVFAPDGKLWVTEKRWNPKRLLAWDLSTKRVVSEKFGMPHYGGDGSGFDPENPRRWIGLGCLWEVDLEQGSSRPTHVMSLEEGHLGHYEPQSYTFFREAGRTFLSTRGKIALLAELLPDGSVRDIAATAGTHHFSYALDWDPPQAYLDAFYAKWPEKRKDEKPGKKGEGKPWSQRGMGVLWVDRNGDGEAQAEEFDFCGDQVDYAGSAWGHLQNSLTFHLPVADKTQTRLVALKPRGFLANGVPDYPTLDEAIAEAVPVNLTPGNKRNGVATLRDRAGRFLFNSDPEMNAYDAEGRHLWTFPNRWSDVHGSHDAPLPEPGVMQGTLAFLGSAPFDALGDVCFLNGNHGRCFLLTTDGLYLDEVFVDVRVSYLRNEYRLGGEIFGGSFARDAKSGKYLVQIGHGPYRIYELGGLERVKRIEGELEVTASQITSAEKRNQRRAAESLAAKEAVLPGTLRWDKSGKFRVQLDLSHDATHLHLVWRVEDPSPWVNQGRDWLKLFATGDTVDLQIATDPEADPKRRDAAPGDQRLLIAPFEGKPLAVLYEHRREAAGETLNPVEFTSPWRAATVDHVRRVPDAKIEVKVESSAYTVTAAIPLTDLGFTPVKGQSCRADFGVTYGDAAGTDTNLRNYWSNQSTMLVDDIPGEILPAPQMWGTLRVE